MGLITLIIIALVVAGLLTRYTRLTPPTQTPCDGDCNQGRNCTCATKTDANWPFPTSTKP